MEIKEFQELSTRTMNESLSFNEKVANMIFGINGEAGEVTDILKKHLYHNHELDLDHLKEEIGDVMFYIVNLATLYGFDMEEILQDNVAKLALRYKKGFTTEESIKRIDINER